MLCQTGARACGFLESPDGPLQPFEPNTVSAPQPSLLRMTNTLTYVSHVDTFPNMRSRTSECTSRHRHDKVVHLCGKPRVASWGDSDIKHVY